MQKVQPEEGESADIVSENMERLKELFPDAFTEGGVNFDVLRQLLGDVSVLDEGEEKYGLNWHGKKKARQIALTPSTGTLLPCPEESVDWETTRNLFIEGDNLEVLKILQKSYANKVKMIYIDPPYNTGKEFVYPDNYQENLETYLRYTGQVDSDGMKLSSNTEKTGRKHGNWLNMMYARLKLARNCLTSDGLIFISIDDNEQANLKKLCDEIFGEENFLGCAARVSKKANNQGDYWSPNFDYIVTYAKNRQECKPFIGGINFDAYNQIEGSGERSGEKYQEIRLYMTSLDPMRGCTNQRYWVECPDGTFVIPPGDNFPDDIADGEEIPPQSGNDKIWRWTKKKYLDEKNNLVIKKVRSSNLVDQDGNPAKWNVYTKTFLQDVIDKASAKPNSLVEDHINQNSSHELKKLSIPFDHAKPSGLIKYLCEIARLDGEDIVMDFFAGSGSTAHGVIQFNQETSQSLRFILVQLPEECDEKTDEFKAGYKTISDIAKERIRRVITSTEDQDSENVGRVGFKCFSLGASSLKVWNPDRTDLEESLLSHVEHIVGNRSERDILYELLLKRGVDLAVPIENREISSKTIYSIGYGVLFACLDESITKEQVEEIGQGIVDWYRELAPSSDTHVFFRDSAFRDDVSKTNMAAILEQNGLTHVRSL